MVPLKEVLEKRFGSDFPVGAGTTKRDDPLVITDRRDYVSIEYGIAKFLLEQMGFEYKFEQQRTHNYEDRIVDELVYAAKEPGEPEWTQTRSFFFDITAGFNRSSTTTPEKPKVPTGHVFGHSNYSSPRKPSRAGHYLVVTLRWLAFLPLAFLAAWLATRFLMFFRLNQFQQNNNPYVVLFFMQAASGAIIGWVGVKVAPAAKTFALVCCALLSALVAAAYFLKFNGLLGGLAAATGLIATIIAGYIARDDD